MHVRRDRQMVKFWLDPLRRDRNIGFSPAEIRQIQRVIEEHQAALLEAWHAYFT